jgi:hypothetical protein
VIGYNDTWPLAMSGSIVIMVQEACENRGYKAQSTSETRSWRRPVQVERMLLCTTKLEQKQDKHRAACTPPRPKQKSEHEQSKGTYRVRSYAHTRSSKEARLKVTT